MVDVMPELRRLRLSDGVSIAHHVTGSGQDLVVLFPYHVNHLELTWATPLHRQAIVRLAGAFRVVNLDLRGAGLSDRDVADVSIDRLGDDVVAVMDHLQVGSAAICAMGNAALVACRLAAFHPQRITRVALIGAGSSAIDGRLLELHDLNPDLQFDVRASVVAGLGDPMNAAALATVMKNAVSADTFSRFLDGARATDLSALIAKVQAPVLLVNATNDQLIPLATAHRLANGHGHVAVLPVEGDSAIAPWRDQVAIGAMIRFLQGDPPEHDTATGRRRRHTTSTLQLTVREADVLRLVSQGRTNRQVADQLYISPNTVSHHLRGIFAKTGSHNRSEAAAFAHRNGLA
jgi:DNA-binding CsgD family transcriptional regulator/pimeloyl-ACP methyl ester carboxylesterase